MLVKLRSNLYFGRKIKVTEAKVKIKILSILLPVIIDYDGKYCKVIFCQHITIYVKLLREKTFMFQVENGHLWETFTVACLYTTLLNDNLIIHGKICN